MGERLLLGDEAVAQAAVDAGVAGAFSYPGTPATEVFEYIEHGAAARGMVSARWSANEKVAYEEALGMSYAGRRAIVSMKHVGLNVAADPFVNSALTGVNGGLLLVVADDPGMHSSQNEQDSRFYGEFAQVPIFEPATQQQAYDMTLEAFEYSERVGLPVMLRLVTRLSHSRANVALREAGRPAAGEARPLPSPDDWTLVPVVARRRFRGLVELQPRLVDDATRSTANRLELAGPRGVIAAGIARNYVAEAAAGRSELSLLELGRYPIPVALVRKLVDHCDEILVVEEGYPWIERRLNGLLGVPGKAIRGRLTGEIPATGELTPETVAAALGYAAAEGEPPPVDLAGRPPQLCQGCPHGDSFRAIVEACSIYERPILFGDIGCYTLGVAPPYRAVHACVDMGASIAMAHGASQTGIRPVICTIGDSTFSHSGMTGLLGAIRSDADMTVFVLDNGTVAMTGTQPSFTTGERLLDVLRGLGVDPRHLHSIDPLPQRHADNVELIRREIEHRGLSVIIPNRACIHLHKKRRESIAVTA
ncbi:MAG TPA: thiamine pyrophosphate-dependent enzyme [Candidatus Polarisedimenticolaceae bacterium]|nr:thiamine pyrophosphate-dependent enzyme [Candidatus Polarisedimenticolaceae bacterium]